MDVLAGAGGLAPFAGPAATIIAAIYVSFITKELARRQAAIAKEQSVTSERKLKLDLFDKRFAIYNAARRVAEITLIEVNPVSDDTSDWPEFEKHYAKVPDARFLFKKQTFHKISELAELATIHRTLVRAYLMKSVNTLSDIQQQNDDLNDARDRLLKAYNELPDVCASELRLDF